LTFPLAHFDAAFHSLIVHLSTLLTVEGPAPTTGMQIPSQKISGIIGAETVSRAAPDGNTLLIHSNSLLIDAHLQKTNDHPLTSFEPICDLVDVPTVIVVNSAAPYRRLADLLNAARAKPGEISLASIGPGSTFRIGFETLPTFAAQILLFFFEKNMPALIYALTRVGRGAYVDCHARAA
jgi:tripartite tricarboxylate transporter family receptor